MLPKLEYIRQARLANGLTQRKLASLSGLSTSMINQIELGRCKPSYETARKIFEALNNLQGKTSVKTGEICSRGIIFVMPNDTVAKAVELMRKNGYSQLPVLKDGLPIGLISEEGIMKALSSGNPAEVSKTVIQQIMEPSPPIIDEVTPAKTIVPLMRFSKVVLTSNRGGITGIITASDLLKLVE
jgi:predicted transcriptional regulator